MDYVIESIELPKSTTKDAITLVEQRVDFSKWIDGGFGTADTIIVADEVLHVIDLKGGKGVAVSADDNPQMKLYATLGALNLFDTFYDIKTVRMIIVQPRLESISTYEVSAEELTQWEETELKPKAQLTINGEGEFCSGDHCRFCRARQTCRARAEEHLALAQYDFKLPALLTDDEIAGILTVADRLSTWASDVYSYATDLAINENKEWTGFKLVEGRSNRKFADEIAVVKICTDNGYTEIYKQTLKGITDMEKYSMENTTKVVTGKARFSYANIWESKSINGGDPKYSVSLIIPKFDIKSIAEIESAIEQAKQDGKAKFGGKVPSNLKTPLRDGDVDRPDDEAYADSYFINVNSKDRPQVVDKAVKPILDQDEVYSGCYGRASINFYAFNTNGNKGIACGLSNIQKLSDGEPLSGRSNATSDFATAVDDDFLN